MKKVLFVGLITALIVSFVPNHRCLGMHYKFRKNKKIGFGNWNNKRGGKKQRRDFARSIKQQKKLERKVATCNFKKEKKAIDTFLKLYGNEIDKKRFEKMMLENPFVLMNFVNIFFGAAKILEQKSASLCKKSVSFGVNQGLSLFAQAVVGAVDATIAQQPVVLIPLAFLFGQVRSLCGIHYKLYCMTRLGTRGKFGKGYCAVRAAYLNEKHECIYLSPVTAVSFTGPVVDFRSQSIVDCYDVTGPKCDVVDKGWPTDCPESMPDSIRFPDGIPDSFSSMANFMDILPCNKDNNSTSFVDAKSLGSFLCGALAVVGISTVGYVTYRGVKYLCVRRDQAKKRKKNIVTFEEKEELSSESLGDTSLSSEILGDTSLSSEIL